MADSGIHRVRRLRWQARAPNAADAFALQRLLHRSSEDVGAALEQAFASIALGDEVWHLPLLTLHLDASSLAQMDADLPTLVADALQVALERAWPADAVRRVDVTTHSAEQAADLTQPTISTTAESAHAALRHYLTTASLPWALAGLGAEAQRQVLQGAAQGALEALLAQQDHTAAVLDDLLGTGTATPLPARIGALLRWLPLLSPAQRQCWLANSPRPAGIAPALADAWFTLLASSSTALEWVALWLVWPTFQGLRASFSTGDTVTGSLDALAVVRWIADLPADIAPLRIPSPTVPDIHLAAALRHALGDAPAKGLPASAPPARQGLAQVRPIAAAPDTQLVPLAGLVLLHPYLPRLLKGCGLVDDTGRAIADAALPRACALLHALACGDGEAAEHQLPLIKLLLGRAPDDALTAALPRPTAADGEEIDSLLVAVRSHWKALGNTSVEGLRLSFLQRRGLLRKAEGTWQMHMQTEGFDLLLDLLPWSISLVKLPWMPLPLMVEWRAP
ncbi:contractile injection system tape measure protein [Sphaerotilus sp.]|uniref:contractile injection system tape measure protein n=1 Tax=Sphaerotilus sp. TaxID=2093942 RepID=UPI00286DA839|nr:contractile injection system tape measure protein [Sphaerotilus sp.]